MAKMEIIIWGYEHKIVDESAKKIIEIARASGSSFRGPVPLPTKRRLFTVLKGVFRHKDSREQFEQKTHKRLIVLQPNSKTVDQLQRMQLASSVNLLVKTI